eukprot:COSAG01_NODE_28_length_36622_cov_14.695751_7_plen_3203_part_00
MLASNYDATAKVDSGSCVYPTDCLAFAGTMLAHYNSLYSYATDMQVNASDMCMLLPRDALNISRFNDTTLITAPDDAATESCTAAHATACHQVALDGRPSTCTSAGHCTHAPKVVSVCRPKADAAGCRGVQLAGSAQQNANTCASHAGGAACTYRAAVDYRLERCEPVLDSAGCRAVTLDGMSTTCTSHAGGSACQYTAADASIGMAEACNPIADVAGCRGTAFRGSQATCEGHSGGSACQYTTRVDYVQASCEPTDINGCSSLTQSSTCAAYSGGNACTYIASASERCTATDMNVCSTVALHSPAVACSLTGTCTFNANVCAATHASACAQASLDGRPSTCTTAGKCSHISPVLASCEPELDSAGCRGVQLAGSAQQNANTCTSHAGGAACTYRAAVDYRLERCEPVLDSAGCRAVTLDGMSTTCTSHAGGSACQYTAADASIGMAEACNPIADVAGCRGTAFRGSQATCEGHSGGSACQYTTRVDYVQASCEPTADQDQCRQVTAMLRLGTATGDMCKSSGRLGRSCLYTASRSESCYATDTTICAAADLQNPEYICEHAGVCTYSTWAVFPEGLCDGLRSPRDMCLISGKKNVFVQGNPQYPNFYARLSVGMEYDVRFMLGSSTRSASSGPTTTTNGTAYALHPQTSAFDAVVILRYLQVAHVQSSEQHISPAVSTDSNDKVGGAVRVAIKDGVVIIDRCKFTGNSGYNGGGIYVSSSGQRSVLHVQQSVFRGNTAHHSGGAMRVENIASVVIRESKFHGNGAMGSLATFGGGGAIFMMSGKLSLSNCQFDSKGSKVTHRSWAAASAEVGWLLLLHSVDSWQSHTSVFSPNLWPSVQSIASTSLSCTLETCPASKRCSVYGSSTWCETCPPKTVSANGLYCDACEPGKEADLNATSCVQCKAGYFSMYGVCNRCPAGRLASDDRIACYACSAGKYTDGAACLSCAPGSEPSAPAATDASPTRCTLCAVVGALTHSADGLACVVCRDGYHVNEDHSACVPCPDRMFGIGGECRYCTDGTYPNANRTACLHCPNRFAGRDGSCAKCPNGTRVRHEICEGAVNEPASVQQCLYMVPREKFTYCNGHCIPRSYKTDCEICPEGWVGTGSVCAPCGVGTLPNFPNTVEPPIWDGATHTWIAVPPARTACLPCPQYMYSPEGKECFWCSPGKIVSGNGTGCEDCPVGRYGLVDDRVQGEQYFSGAMERSVHPNVLIYGGHGTTCASCEAGSEPRRGNVTDYSVAGATGCLRCEALGPGMYSADGLRCILCPSGTFPNNDRTRCLRCAPGYFGVSGGCERCADGKEPNAEQTSCALCPPYFAGRDGFCDRCPNGTRVLGDGTDTTDCEICPEGWVGTGSVCAPCGVGTLPNFPNTVEPPIWDGATHTWIAVPPARTACLPCPQYMYSPEGKECFWCSPGKIVTDVTGCEDCPVGRYGLVDDRVQGEQYFSGAMERSVHPNVLTYGGHGTTCASCEAGSEPRRGNVTDYSVAGATGCLRCEALGPGMYSADGLRCILCPSGTFPNNDRTRCLQCPTGYSGLLGQCHLCAPGLKPDVNFSFVQLASSGRACRGDDEADNSNLYYSMPAASQNFQGNSDTCRVTCFRDSECQGFEYNTLTGRCEIWNRMPLATAASTPGYTCFQKVPDRANTICTPCNFTSWSIRGVCFQCNDGTRPNPSQTGCDSCPVGEAGTGGTCRPCLPGTFYNADHTACINCAPGKYSTYGTTCENCVGDGKYTPLAGVSCVACPPGKCNNPEHSGCLPCGSGQYGVSGICRLCPDGKQPDTSHQTCSPCPDQFFGIRGRCGVCMDGTYPNVNRTSCLDCLFGEAGMGGMCKKCRAGTYPNQYLRATQCLDCEFGKYSPNGDECLWCKAGFRPNPIRTGCLGCREGWFSNDIQNATHTGVYCRRCDRGSEPNSRFAADGCDRCRASQYSAGNGSFCAVCSDGKQPNPSQAGCDQCPAAHAGTGGSCSACPAGKMPDAPQVTCVDCPHAMFGIDGTCSMCDDGKEPARDKTSCTACKYAHAGLRGECYHCEAGTQSNKNRTRCNRCESNEISPAGEICQLCPPGSQARADNKLCTLCPPGKYKTDMRNVSCSSCAIGHRPNRIFQSGSTGCRLCPVDTISTDGLECRACSTLIGEKSASNVERTSCHCINGTEYKNEMFWTGYDWIDLGPTTAKCNDINECRDLDPCDILVVCVNLPKESPADDGYSCTTCPDGYVGDGVKAHGGCFPEMVHITGGEEPLEPTFPMEIVVTDTGNIGGHTNPPSAAQMAYRKKLAAGIAEQAGVLPSLIEITRFDATALADTAGGQLVIGLVGRRLETTSWDVNFEFAVKARRKETIASLDRAFNRSQSLHIMVDDKPLSMSFPTRHEYVGGQILEVTYSLYNFMEIKCPILTFRKANSSKCLRCQPGYMVNNNQTGCLPCSDFPGKYSPDGTPCIPCQPGSEPNKAQTACAGCPQNYYSGDGVECKRCPSYQVTRLLPMQTSSDACVCEQNMYNQTLQSPHLSCFKWNGVQLAVASDDAAGPCRRCPEDEHGQLFPCVACDHGFNSSALLMPGYWRTSPNSPYIFQCEFGPEACLGQWGGLDQNSMPIWASGGCGAGYTGVTCASCVADHRRLTTGCEKCPGAAFLVFIVSASVSVAFAVGLIWRSNAVFSAPSIAQALRSGATASEIFITGIRTLLSFCTVQSLIGEIDNRWPAMHGNMFWLYGAASDVSRLVEFSRCVPSVNPFWNDSMPFVLSKAVMTIVLPVVVVIGVIAFYTMPHCLRYTKYIICKRVHKSRVNRYTATAATKTEDVEPAHKGAAAYLDDVLAAATVLLYILHPAVIRMTLSLFPCRELEGGLRVMAEDTGVECGISDRGSTVAKFGIPSAVVLCAGLPLLASWRVWRMRRADKLRQLRVQRRYGWLLRGYVHACCCWELVVTLRKAGVALAVVLLSAYGTEVQSLAVLIVLHVALVAHMRYRPLHHSAQNRLEGLALSTHLLTVAAGIFFRATHVDKIGVAVDGGMYNVISSGVVGLNFSVFGMMTVMVCIQVWKERMGVARQPLTPDQDPDDAQALAANHKADLIQRFLRKARAFEDSALTLETVRHQLHQMLLLLPEHARDLGGLLSWADRLGGTVTNARLRALEVQRRHRDKLQPAKRVQEALAIDQEKLQLLSIAGQATMVAEVGPSADVLRLNDAVALAESQPPPPPSLPPLLPRRQARKLAA